MSEEKTATADTPRKKLTYKDIKKRKKPAIRKVPIALDGEQADAFNEKRSVVEDLREQYADNPRDKDLKARLADEEAELEAMREDLRDNVVDFVFRSIGRQGFEDLVEECPPTKKQKDEAAKKGEEEPTWNGDLFPPRLIAAALVEPELSEDEVQEIWEDEAWNQAELISLFLAALTVNQERKVVELGKGSGQTTN